MHAVGASWARSGKFPIALQAAEADLCDVPDRPLGAETGPCVVARGISMVEAVSRDHARSLCALAVAVTPDGRHAVSGS